MTLKLRVLAALFFALVALGVSFQLGKYSPHHTSEKRSDAIVAEMLRTGEWGLPTQRDGERLQKPPLYYWAAASVAELSGGSSAATLRSVSALAGFALVAVIFGWGSRAIDPATGLVAAAALCAMDQFWTSARLGTPDMLLALGSSAALFAFERLWSSGDARLLPVSSFFAALAFLSKATFGLVCVFVPIGAWLAFERRLARGLKPVALSAALASGAGLAWYVAVLLLVPEARGYLPHLLGALAPAVVLLPLVIHDGVRTQFFRDTPPLRFAATGALSLFVTWALIPQKGLHYLLPILPLFALLAGNALVRAARRT